MQLGIIYSLSASALFGGMYYLATLLRRLSGESLFGIRMVVTLPFLLFALFVLKKQAEFGSLAYLCDCRFADVAFLMGAE